MKPTSYDIFISYRRSTGSLYSRTILQSLRQRGYSGVFFDYEELNEGFFNEKIVTAISTCKDFLLILSKDSMTRCCDKEDWVAKEIRTAISYGCNIIPVAIADFEQFPVGFPKELARIQNIQQVKYQDNEYYDAFIQKLVARLKSKVPEDSIGTTFKSEVTDDSFLTNLDELQIGDYYYFDGTFSRHLLKAKQCVGVVFSLETSDQEKKNGWTHGQIVAMEDAAQRTTWCSKIGMAGTNFPTAANYEYFADGGYYLSTYSLDWGLINYGKLPELTAIKKATEFNLLPIQVPKTSGWYLPDALQMVQLLKNLGGAVFVNEGFDQKNVMAHLERYNISMKCPYYWTSTLAIRGRFSLFSKDMYAWRVNMKEGKIQGAHENTALCAVRAVAAI